MARPALMQHLWPERDLSAKRTTEAAFRRIVVALDSRPQSARALDAACRLATETRATIAAVAVLELPPALPLDAHLFEAERGARRLLTYARGTADRYGVAVREHIVRTHDAGEAILAEAARLRADLLVIGASSSAGSLLDETSAEVVRRAGCRVLLVVTAARPRWRVEEEIPFAAGEVAR